MIREFEDRGRPTPAASTIPHSLRSLGLVSAAKPAKLARQTSWLFRRLHISKSLSVSRLRDWPCSGCAYLVADQTSRRKSATSTKPGNRSRLKPLGGLDGDAIPRPHLLMGSG